MVKAQVRSKHWEQKAKASVGKTASMDRERDEAKEEAQLAWLVALVAGDVKALVEEKLARVQDALAIMEKARRKTKAEVSRLEVERTSLMLEIGVA